MTVLDDDAWGAILTILKRSIRTRVRYVPYGDGEQNMSVFYRQVLPFALVSTAWEVAIMGTNQRGRGDENHP